MRRGVITCSNPYSKNINCWQGGRFLDKKEKKIGQESKMRSGRDKEEEKVGD